jgi:hypothetical protein
MYDVGEKEMGYGLWWSWGAAGIHYVAQDKRDDTGRLGVLERDGISAYTVRPEA